MNSKIKQFCILIGKTDIIIKKYVNKNQCNFHHDFKTQLINFYNQYFENNEKELSSITNAIENKNSIHFIIIGRVHDKLGQKKRLINSKII